MSTKSVAVTVASPPEPPKAVVKTLAPLVRVRLPTSREISPPPPLPTAAVAMTALSARTISPVIRTSMFGWPLIPPEMVAAVNDVDGPVANRWPPRITIVPAGPAGTIVIRGGHLFATGPSTSLTAATISGGMSGQPNIDVRITGDMVLADRAVIATAAVGSGGGGDISLDVGSLTLTSGARVLTTAFGGSGGLATVTATDFVDIVGRSSSGQASGLFTLTQSASSGGTGGALSIRAPSLRLNDGGTITTQSTAAAAGGNVALQVDNLSITRGASINSNASSRAAGGDLTVTVKDSTLISGVGRGIFSQG